MDSLTHVVLGAAIGHQILNKTTGKRALLYGAIIGSLPDIDIVFGKFTDPITAIEIHRGFTHSVFVFLMMTPLLSWLIHKVERNKKTKLLSINLFVFLALFTHSFLDILTTWGTQLFWPFPLKIAIQSIFVADPLFTLPILFGLILSLFKKTLKPNIIGLSIGATYLLWGLFIKNYTLNQFERALQKQNITYLDIQNKPSPLNSILWSANVMSEDGFYIGYYSLFDSKPIEFMFFPKNHQLISNELNNDYNFNRLKKISDQWFTITKKNDQLIFNDLRFGMLGLDQNNDFVFSYTIKKLPTHFEFIEKEKDSEQGKELLKKLFNRLKGN